MEGIEKLQSSALRGVPHGFLGRRGGVSTGIHAGLNVGLGSDDNPAAIAENRDIARNAILPGAKLCTLFQIHSADVVTVTGPSHVCDGGDRPRADAMVTDKPGCLLGILTADCTPILFADKEAGVVGAAHAGWKGAISGVGEATVSAMERLGADRSRTVAAIGPCIAQKSYEVDESFFRRFTEEDNDNERFFADGQQGHYQFDLEGYNAARLAAAGITTVECLGEDTYSQEERFFSYRLSRHRGEPDYGRQISMIGLPA